MVEMAVIHMTTHTLRDEIFSAVYGMLASSLTNENVKRMSDDQIRDMCLKYANSYSQKVLEKALEKKAKLQ